MTVWELITTLQRLIAEDDNGSDVAHMEVWINRWGDCSGEAPVKSVIIDDNQVWL